MVNFYMNFIKTRNNCAIIYHKTLILFLTTVFPFVALAKGIECSTLFLETKSSEDIIENLNLYKNNAVKSLNVAIQSAPSTVFSKIFDSSIQGFIKEAELNLINTSAINLKSVRESFRTIKTIWDWGSRFDSRLVLIEGNVFVEGYYRNQRYFNKEHLNATEITKFDQFARQQPWFSLDTNKTTYRLSENEAQSYLLRHIRNIFGNTTHLSLFRGLRQDQTNLILHAKKLRQKNLSNEDKAILLKELNSHHDYHLSLVQSDIESSNQRKIIARELLVNHFRNGKRNESFFTSPDLEFAKRYACPFVLKSSLSFEELEGFSNRFGIYVGIEYDFFEIMLYEIEAIESFADHAEIVFIKND